MICFNEMFVQLIIKIQNINTINKQKKNILFLRNKYKTQKYIIMKKGIATPCTFQQQTTYGQFYIFFFNFI